MSQYYQEPGMHCEYCRKPMPKVQRYDVVAFCSDACGHAYDHTFDCTDCDERDLPVTHECPAHTPGEHHRDLHGVQCHCDQTPWAYRARYGTDWIVGCDKCPHEPVRAPKLADAIALWTGWGRREEDPPGVAEADAIMDSREARA